MKMIDLARELGISTSMVSRLAKRGMPTDSVERAARWRRRHLEPARTKRPAAVDSPPAPAAQKAPPTPPRIQHPSSARQAAEALMQYAGEMLERGEDIARLVPSLRGTLATVPVAEREAVVLPVPVMDVLVADVLAIVRECEAEALAPVATVLAADAQHLASACEMARAADGGRLSDEEADWMGSFWYRVAAGEITLAHPSPT